MLKIETNGSANIIMLIDVALMKDPNPENKELLMKIRREARVLEAYIKELGEASKENRSNLMWHEIKERIKNG